MYLLCRLCSYVIEQHDLWEKHIVHKTKTKFLLSDEQFDFLRNLQVEYDYTLADNVILIDRHPSVLENHVPENFLNDYINHINDKFSVLYEYRQVDYV